jgi:hypothetical protein
MKVYQRIPVVETKPVTAWSVASLVSSIVGWLVGLPLVFLNYDRMMGETAGLGLLGPFLWGLLSATLCLFGAIFGIVGLIQLGGSQCHGRVTSWLGISLGGLALMIYLVALGRHGFGWW